MMTITRSRVLAVVLAVAMILSLIPVMAAAEEADNYMGFAKVTYPTADSTTYTIETGYFNAQGEPVEGNVAVRIASPEDDLFYYDMIAVKEDGEVKVTITMTDEDAQGRYDVEFINADLGDQRYACYYFTDDSEGDFEAAVAEQVAANNFISIEVQQMLATSDSAIYKNYVVNNNGVSKEYADAVMADVAVALEGVNYDSDYIDEVEKATVVALFDNVSNNYTKSYMDTLIADEDILDLIEDEDEDFSDAREKLEGLSSSAKAQVATKMCAFIGEFDSISDIVDAVVDSLPEEKETTKPGSSSVSGGGSGSGSAKPQPPIVTPTIAVTNIFTDIDETAYWWMIQPLQVLYDNGFINGRTATTFAPGENITRAEYLKILVAELGLTAPGATENFDDVSSYDWYYNYVVTGASLGIVKGRTETEFAPNDLITREEICVMTMRAVRAANVKMNTVPTGATFTDQASISDWATTDVATLKDAGIVSGRDTGAFDPKANATRAEAVKILHGVYILK